MTPDQIRERVSNSVTLPAIPLVARRLAGLLEGESDIKEIAALVEQDPNLSGQILKLVNSPLYGFPGRVANISHALILLGLDVIKGLAVSVPVLDFLRGRDYRVWQYALNRACSALATARELGLHSAGEIGTAALIAGTGRALIPGVFPEQAAEIAKANATKERYLHEIERSILGADAGQIGGWIAEAWQLPAVLYVPISCQYQQETEQDQAAHGEVCAAVHVSNAVAMMINHGSDGERFIAPVRISARERLHLGPEHLVGIFSRALTDLRLLSASDLVTV